MLSQGSSLSASPPASAMKPKISLAQWALVDEIRQGIWSNIDFPRIAREDFGLDAIEFVNQLFPVPTIVHQKALKEQAEQYGVEMLLIMVDQEGDGAAATFPMRKQFAINHRKWVDIAHFLGCHTVRTNCRGPEGGDPGEMLKWATESYSMLLDYAEGSGIHIVIENHGGISNDADWMVELVKAVDHPLFGTYPDWRSPTPEFNNFDYVEKTIPYATGTSFRNQPSEAESARLIKICQDAGYKGYYGIESSGRPAIHEGIRVLKKYL